MLNKEVGYLKVNRFGAKTYDEFSDSLKKLNELGMKKLILDLRDNGGGYLDKAIKIADAFLKKGKLIVYTKGKESSFDERDEATSTGEFENGNLVVLINEYSASASEIVSGALQDNDRAIIVGRRSYGKGLVQRPIPLSDGSNLRLTISRYYTPSGRSIQKPYDGNSDYGGDISERYNSGEMFSADSVKFNESLKYETTSGRTVYGGGGIMPDHFVPIDTSHYNSLYKAVISKNLLRSFALRYSTRNKKELESGGFQRFKKRFEFVGNIEEQFLETIQEVGITLNDSEYAQSKNQIASEIKSFIARNIWQDAGFYPVLHQSDKTLQKAMELIEKE
jgi:carboxyl-terminal processing protease